MHNHAFGRRINQSCFSLFGRASLVISPRRHYLAEEVVPAASECARVEGNDVQETSQQYSFMSVLYIVLFFLYRVYIKHVHTMKSM